MILLYICLYFTKYDADILAWVNMLTENKFSPATWIQALIIAEDKQLKLDIGSVVPTPPRAAVSQKSALFGDDTRPSRNGVYKIGDHLNIRVTRKTAREALERIVEEGEMTAPFIKKILRKNIGCLVHPPNIPPDPAQLRDIFVRSTRSERKKDQKSGIRTTVETPPRTQIEPPAAKKPKNPLLSQID